MLTIAILSLTFALVQIAAAFQTNFPPELFPPALNPGLLPSAFERDPATCGLVLCGLDHTLFHFAQVPFLLALAFFGYQAYRVMRREYDHDVSHPNERKEISDDSGKSAPSS